MVKKVSGPKGPEKATGVSSVTRADEVNAVTGVSGITGVSQVGAVSGVSSTGGVKELGERLTSKNQEEVLKSIETEAEKLFAGQKIPRKRQKTITDALKMAVIAATLRDEEE